MDADEGGVQVGLGAVLGRFLDSAHRVPPHELVALIVASGRELGATSVRVWLADHEQRRLVALDDPADPEPLVIEATTAGRAFVSGEPIQRPTSTAGAHLWLPLLDGVDRIGVLELDLPRLGPTLVTSLRHLASVATAELITRGQYTDRFTEARRRRRMTLAAELQWQALPPTSFTTRDVAVAGLLEPAYDVGGDTFDYAHAEDLLHLAVLDAVGHDLGSALICTLALGAYRNVRRAGGDLRAAAQAMDDAVRGQLGRGSFATGQLGTLDTVNGVFRWLNAGHPPPLLVRDGHVRPLVCRPRLPFGLGHLGSSEPWTVAEDQLQPGDAVLLYTDGVVEARKPGGEDFGEERLMEFLLTAFAAGLAPHETLRRLSHAVVDFHDGVLRDDATNLLVVWQPEHH